MLVFCFFFNLLWIFSTATDTGIVCTQDVKDCPDGSQVSRDPNNNCEFFPCPPIACTLDAKICPDGSVVSRDPNNNCEFFPCPTNDCTSAVNPGSGNLGLLRWYYDTSNNQCKQFKYGGIGGNGNRYRSRQDCESKCCSVIASCFAQPCLLNKCPSYPNAKCYDSYCGGCNAIFYDENGIELLPEQCCSDASSTACLAAPCTGKTCPNYPNAVCNDIYCNGCEAIWTLNGNIITQEQCDNPCRTKYADIGTSDNCVDSASLKYSFNADINECNSFNYQGCDGTTNRFDSLEICNSKCCTLKTCDPNPCESSQCSVNGAVCTNNKCNDCKAIWKDIQGNILTDDQCRGCICTAQYDPVCCDGKSYSNLCVAQCKLGNNAQCIAQPTCDDCTGKCAAYPNAKCITDPCNNCEATFYDENDRKLSKEECSKNVCNLDADPGLCKAAINRYWFNDDTNQCETFVYGGCGGNGNNFETEKDCTDKCCSPVKCFADPCTVSTCYAPDAVCTANYCNGCNAIWTNSKTGKIYSEEECHNRCNQPFAEVGECDGSFPRFSYNVETNRCQSFVYGGCGGNGNNFETEKECNDLCYSPCKDKFSEVGNDCDPKVEYKKLYSFNSQTHSCETYQYLGCNGNDNSFVDLNDCQSKCCKAVYNCLVSPCSQSSCVYKNSYCTDNYCDGCNAIWRDKDTNRVLSKEECVNPCTLTKSVVGPCEALIPSYSYDAEHKVCEAFNYGGCGGNSNRFNSQTLCEQQCCESQVQCLVAPCSQSKCYYKGAKCYDSYCNGCNAIWRDINGNILTEQQCKSCDNTIDDNRLDRSDCYQEPPKEDDNKCSVTVKVEFQVCSIKVYENKRGKLWENIKNCVCNDLFDGSSLASDHRYCYITKYLFSMIEKSNAKEITDSNNNKCDAIYSLAFNVGIYDKDCDISKKVYDYIIKFGTTLSNKIQTCNIRLSKEESTEYPDGFGGVTSASAVVTQTDSSGNIVAETDATVPKNKGGAMWINCSMAYLIVFMASLMFF